VLKEKLFVELFNLVRQADAYNIIPHESDLALIRPELYDSVWSDVKKIRDSGDLLDAGRSINCPVVAIHGDYDPRKPKSQNPSSHITNLPIHLTTSPSLR